MTTFVRSVQTKRKQRRRSEIKTTTHTVICLSNVCLTFRAGFGLHSCMVFFLDRTTTDVVICFFFFCSFVRICFSAQEIRESIDWGEESENCNKSTNMLYICNFICKNNHIPAACKKTALRILLGKHAKCSFSTNVRYFSALNSWNWKCQCNKKQQQKQKKLVLCCRSSSLPNGSTPFLSIYHLGFDPLLYYGVSLFFFGRLNKNITH